MTSMLVQSTRRLSGFLHSAAQFRRMAENLEFDVVNFHLPNALLHSMYFGRRIPTVATVHGPVFENPAIKVVQPLILPVLSRRCDAVVTVKQYLSEEIGRYVGHVTFIPNGIDELEVSRAARADLPPESGQLLGTLRRYHKLIVCVGRLERRKGQHLLIQALPDILEKVPEAVCLFVGEGPHRSFMEPLSRALGVDRSTVFVGYQQIPYPFIAASDVVVGTLSKTLKGTDLVHMEALALGKPLVCSFDDETFARLGGCQYMPTPRTDSQLPRRFRMGLPSSPVSMLTGRKRWYDGSPEGRQRTDTSTSTEVSAGSSEGLPMPFKGARGKAKGNVVVRR